MGWWDSPSVLPQPRHTRSFHHGRPADCVPSTFLPTVFVVVLRGAAQHGKKQCVLFSCLTKFYFLTCSWSFLLCGCAMFAGGDTHTPTFPTSSRPAHSKNRQPRLQLSWLQRCSLTPRIGTCSCGYHATHPFTLQSLTRTATSRCTPQDASTEAPSPCGSIMPCYVHCLQQTVSKFPANRPERLDCSKLAPLQRRVQTHGCQKPTARPSAPLAAVLLPNTAHRCLQLRLPCSTPPQVCRHSHGLQPRGVHPKMPALKHLHLVPLQCHVLSAAYSKQWQSFQQTGPSFLTARNSRLCSTSSAPCAAAKI